MSRPGRYDAVGTTSVTEAGGEVPYLRRRFLPQPDTRDSHPRAVRTDDRLDRVAAVELGDAEQAWVIADANLVMRPSELSGVEREIRIPETTGIVVSTGAQ